ncbi:MAG: LPS export ABC transporter permease LptF [Betaproteobacteria bacterium]
MLFRRALLRELTGTAIAVFLVVLAIGLSRQLVRMLDLAAGGSVPSDSVFALLGFSAIFYLPLALSVTLFLTVLLVLTRAYRDSEMIVWFTTGVSLTAWIRPILMFATPLVVIVGVLSLGLSPWAEQKTQEYKRILESRNEATALAPGLFKEARRADLIYFIESFNPLSNQINNVFIQSVENGKSVVTAALSGYLDTLPNGEVYLVLLKGRRYEGEPGSPEFRVVDFAKLGRHIETGAVRPDAPTLKSTSTAELVDKGGPQATAEIFWRLALPIMSLLLTLMAIPLSYVNPRIGRSFNLMIAILVFAIYYNWISFAQSNLGQGNFGLPLALLITHGVMAVTVALLFQRQLSIHTLLRSIRRPS